MMRDPRCLVVCTANKLKQTHIKRHTEECYYVVIDNIIILVDELM